MQCQMIRHRRPWRLTVSESPTTHTRRPAYAGSVIETMIAEVSPGARVWWVNINVRDSSTNIVSSGVMNSSLGDRHLADPDFAVIDWYTVSQSNPTWFANDNVHYTSAGYRARADQIVEAIRRNSER